MGWRAFIEDARPAEHAVQVYSGVDELAGSVGAFVDAGLDAGAPAVVIATPPHWERIAAELETRGRDVPSLRSDGTLVYRDADEALASVMAGDLPDVQRFEQLAGSLIDEVSARSPGRNVRAFGEMVDLLWRRGRHAAALALEALWDDLALTHRFCLLCGYQLDVFDVDVQRSLPAVLGAHSVSWPADPSRLGAAVDEALRRELGPIGTARAYLEVAEQVPHGGIPRPQAVLQWVSALEPSTATRVLEAARTSYTRTQDGDAP